jgi:SOS-response transcriptional repressor LexA
MEKLFGIGDVVRKLRLIKAKMDLIPFAKFAGINKGTLSKIENGGNCEIDTLEKIAVALGMSPSELYAYLDVYYSKPAQAAEFLKSAAVAEPEIHYVNHDAPRPIVLARVRYYDAIPAGDPRETNPEGQMWIDIVHSGAKDTWYALRVLGDSMAPDYLDGDIVLVDSARTPVNGDIVAALTDGSESTLKLYSKKDDMVTLTPINKKKHRDRTFHASRVNVQGVLVELVRRSPRRKR